jgi:hypothetical protein
MDPRRLEYVLEDLWHSLAKIDVLAVEIVERDHGRVLAADGYPSKTLGGGGGSGESTSTEASALADYRLTCDAPDCGRPVPCAEHAADVDHGANGRWTEQVDPIHECVAGFEAAITAARGHLKLAHKQLLTARHRSNLDRRHTNPPTDCLACTRTVACTTADPLRSGHCKNCAEAWRRFKETERAAGRHPDLVTFRIKRLERTTNHDDQEAASA